MWFWACQPTGPDSSDVMYDPSQLISRRSRHGRTTLHGRTQARDGLVVCLAYCCTYKPNICMALHGLDLGKLAHKLDTYGYYG
ncbi:hypothetical protein VNO77_03713 [Canavalia gladiata]|uniref:Uncharacterized protein n=1 Tax=Canavalia gladiata TaxID=3824 RepID=A0AAN9N0D1_CANGL